MQVKYSKHEVFQKPTKEKTKIWRYMNFKKFESTLNNQALYFCRTDKFRDPLEGTLSEPTKVIAEKTFKEYPDAYRTWIKAAETHKRCSVVSCWTMNEKEPKRLWKEYVKGSGVAIQSTFNRLINSFNPNANHSVFVGTVQYINHKTDRQYVRNMYYPLIYKSKNFEFEKELRAIVMEHKIGKNNKVSLNQTYFNTGEFIEIDLDKLIEKIIVSPNATDAFITSVKAIIKKNNLKKDIFPFL